ncbi:MAG: diaminopimelate epimerase [Alistipes sp.]|nr:diaminopimelate epimerase [Alistipes sp.]
MIVEIIKCHGSGNEFIMVDMVAMQQPIENMAAFAQQICAHHDIEGADGILYVVKYGERYAMRMFNPDGSEAEMCGNGIRCVARLVQERYIHDKEFVLISGNGEYPIYEAEPVNDNIKTYGVDIHVKLESADFGFANGDASHIGKEIHSLDEDLQFTALNLGNPHIVAAVEEIDMDYLITLGERVKVLRDDFPRGINVSLYRKMEGNAIFVATFERGAGITYSCGTAMTASSTAAALIGICRKNEDILVYNRGGMVRCLCNEVDGKIVTRLIGNATYEWSGICKWDGAKLHSIVKTEAFNFETEAYNKFVSSIR